MKNKTTASFVIAATLFVFSPVDARQRAAPDPNRPVSILVLDFAGDGHQLTSPAQGVGFDIDGIGKRSKIGWTTGTADDAFLFLDTNGNGTVDTGRELLGDGWRLPNGSRSLSVDSTLAAIQGFLPPVGNPPPRGIGWIDRDDEVFGRLRIWQDSNHDGISQPRELTTAASRRIDRILLSFQKLLNRAPDANGNILNFEGDFFVGDQRRTAIQRRMTDITLKRE